MKNKKAYVLTALIVILVGVAAWYTNWGPFQGTSVAGIPNGHIRVLDPGSLYGSVSFNYFGHQVQVYVAYFQRDTLVIHELVLGISGFDERDINGELQWATVPEINLTGWLPVLRVGGMLARGSFDFSVLDFEIATAISADSTISPGRIERGRRYVINMWQSGNTFMADGDFFNPEQLRTSEHTAILYVVFS